MRAALRAGVVSRDRKLFDEQTLAHDRSYAESLQEIGRRYVAVAVPQMPDRNAVVTIQRSHRPGPVRLRETALMHRLSSHL